MISLLSVQPSTFISDNTVEQVALVGLPATATNLIAKENNIDGSTYGLFQLNDNFKLLGIAVYLPHLYAVGRDTLQIKISSQSPPSIPSTGFWNDFESIIPVYQENVEIDLDAFIRYDKNTWIGTNGPFGIGCSLSGSIGMFNAPSMLNGVTLSPTIVLRVEHSLPLVVFP